MSKNWVRITAECILIVMEAALVYMGRVPMGACVFLVALLLISEINERLISNRVVRKILTTLFVAYMMWMLNDLMAIGKFSMYSGMTWVLNYVLYLMPFILILGISGKRRISYLLPEILFIAISVANLIVKAIRRTPISAGDLYSVKTAMAVAGNYHMQFDKEFLIKAGLGIGIVILTQIILNCYYRKEEQIIIKSIATRGILSVCAVLWGIILFATTSIVTISGQNPDYFSHETNGFALNLYLQWKDISIKAPTDYALDELENLQGKYSSDEVVTDEQQQYPNIIAIMNESFADLRVLGEYSTNIEVLPYLDSLSKNTIKGTLYSSVYGGNTANSEYEFLTGCSIAYFSERVVPYQLFMNEQRPSLISQMKDMGYETVFMHPYRSYSWNRPSVYSALGVDEMIYEEDMDNLEYIRSYASDASQYEYVKKYLESDRDKPLFLFDVTVQNHGGYTGEISGLPEKVTITGHEGQYTETENYLTLVHESDRALGELLSYLENYDEPTIVVFYGDHQPAIETGFIEMAMNKSESDFTLEDRQKMYQVPFFIWSNYSMEEERIDAMSINYLSTLLCEKLGLPMTGMQKYLQELRLQLPVINSVCMIDAQKQYRLKTDIMKDDSKGFIQYNQIIYNYMFDTKNRLDTFYQLNTKR